MSHPDDPGLLTLTAYFAERQRSGKQFLADALLDLFEQRRIAASVVVRGIASFGPAKVTRSDRSLSLSEDPPVVISAVDRADRIGSLAVDVAALLGRGLLTVERGGPPPGPSGPLDPDAMVRLSLHLGRRRRIAGASGYIAVCDVLHRLGFAAADVILGVDGTVGGERRRAKFVSRNADVPLWIVGIGTVAQAGAAVEELRALVPDAVFTSEPIALCRNDGRNVADPPPAVGPFQRLTVHTTESSSHGGRPIHRALIERLKGSEHASGATVLRAIWGFRGAERPHGDRFLQIVRDVPVATVVVDTADGIAAIYPLVEEVTEQQGLVTVEPLAGMLEVDAGRRRGTLHHGPATGGEGSLT